MVFWFLRDWRATLISAVAMPLSVIPTFFVMHWLGFTLNLITLLGLSLVVGILVDDAIVEIENIVRHMRMGKTPMQAALDAADEIGLAVVATTLTIVAVFLPVSFMSGVPGQFFRQFGYLGGDRGAVLAAGGAPADAGDGRPICSKPHEEAQHESDSMDALSAPGATGAWRTASSRCSPARVLFVGSMARSRRCCPRASSRPPTAAQATMNFELPPGTPLEETVGARPSSARQLHRCSTRK